MNLNVSGHHLDVTSAIQNHIKGKLARITRHCDQVFDIDVILSTDKLDRAVRKRKEKLVDHHNQESIRRADA